MKLVGDKAKEFLTSARDTPALTIVFSQDEARSRRELQLKVHKTLGENAASEMRLTHFQAKEVSSDPAIFNDAIRTQSFFPGPCGVIIYAATDAFSKVLIDAMDSWQNGDAHIFVQTGNLTKTSKIRKAFEPHKNSMVIGLYQDPVNRRDIINKITKSGVKLETDANEMLASLGLELDPFEFDNLVEKLRLYQGDAPQISTPELLPLLPTGHAEAVDDIIHQLLTGQNAPMLKNLKRAPAQGVSIYQILAMANIQIRSILAVKSSKDSSAAISRLRPPLFGPRRDKFMAQLRYWPAHQVEIAQKILADTEKVTRQGNSNIPLESYVERQFLKICLMARKNKGA